MNVELYKYDEIYEKHRIKKSTCVSFFFHIIVWILHSITCKEFLFPEDCQIQDSIFNRGESLFALVCLLNFDIPVLNTLYCVSVVVSGFLFSSLGYLSLFQTDLIGSLHNPYLIAMNSILILFLFVAFWVNRKQCNKLKLFSVWILFYLRFISAKKNLHLHHFMIGFLLNLAYTPPSHVCFMIRGCCIGVMIQGLGIYTAVGPV